jgi:formylglycine-generating enzyme required for sulfatase activity
MKKAMISLFALLLLAAQAQAQKEPLAVLVIGVDSWMFGDVIAHIVGEELRRSNSNLVPVTREKFVQNKLKALRRATGEVDLCELRKWSNVHGLSKVCFVKAQAGHSFSSATQAYSAQLISVADSSISCRADFVFAHAGAPGEMTPAELTKVAWEVVGRLQSSSCRPSHVRCFTGVPEMVFVKGGTFTMGCKSGRELDDCSKNINQYTRNSSEVTMSDFWIGRYEVTQGEWNWVMGNTIPEVTFNDTRGKGVYFPAYNVNHADAQAFVKKLSELTGKNYQLPTEAQWEYAARGGDSCNYPPYNTYKYSGSNTIDDVAWYGDPYDVEGGNAAGTSHETGTKAPNRLGIYDMSGNVYEWCLDCYGPNDAGKDIHPIAANERNDPIYNPESCYSDRHAMRGGVYRDRAEICASYHRTTSSFRGPYGFRVVLLP